MFSGHRHSVRTTIAWAIFLVLLSWIISTGIANYLNYLSMVSLHEQLMMRLGKADGQIPRPKFGIIEFLGGRPPHPPPPEWFQNMKAAESSQANGKPTDTREVPQINKKSEEISRPFDSPQFRRRRDKERMWLEFSWILIRLLLAVGLAAIAGILLGRRFTNPLLQLAKGANEFHKGNFNYRIPEIGEDEFATVAAAMNEMARRVSDQINDLEDDAERRRQFMADIAHELRSPVTTMRTMAGALNDGIANQPERRDRAVAALVRTSERLLRLVQELMELSKLDINEFPLNLRKADIRELAESIIQSYETDAQEAGIILRHIDSGPKVEVFVDPDRIAQVLDNVVGNAVEYAGRGSEISITIEETSAEVILSVHDSGKGISQKDLPYVFDSFYRADTARSPGGTHSGLGLSISRKLIEVHGGQMFITSIEGKGTDVIIQIPKNELL